MAQLFTLIVPLPVKQCKVVFGYALGWGKEYAMKNEEAGPRLGK